MQVSPWKGRPEKLIQTEKQRVGGHTPGPALLPVSLLHISKTLTRPQTSQHHRRTCPHFCDKSRDLSDSSKPPRTSDRTCGIQGVLAHHLEQWPSECGRQAHHSRACSCKGCWLRSQRWFDETRSSRSEPGGPRARSAGGHGCADSAPQRHHGFPPQTVMETLWRMAQELGWYNLPKWLLTCS